MSKKWISKKDSNGNIKHIPIEDKKEPYARNREQTVNKSEIKIIWTKRKHKPTVEEIRKLAKDNDVEIYGAPLEFAEKLMGHLGTHEWKIYEDNEDEAPLSVNTYWANHETLTQGLPRVYKIFILKESAGYGGYPYAHVILRR